MSMKYCKRTKIWVDRKACQTYKETMGCIECAKGVRMTLAGG